MKIFGSITELVNLVFRKNGQAVTFRPNQATTYTASRDLQLPPGDAAHVLVSADSTQTLTNKTMSGASNTFSNISLTGSVTGILPGANGGTGINNAGTLTFGANSLTFSTGGATSLTLPASGTLATLAGSETLSNKTLASPDVTTQVRLLNQGQLQLREGTGGGTDQINIQAPATLAASYTLTLPVDDGTSNQVLTTDGNGVLSWAASAAVPAAGAVYSNGTALQTTGAFTGNANKVVGVNSGETATEYKTIATGTAGTNFAVAFAAGSVTLNLPDASGANRGAVTTANQVFGGRKNGTNSKVSAYRSTNQTITTSTLTRVQFNTETFDTNNEFDATGTDRFTPTRAGYYLVCLYVFTTGTALGTGQFWQSAIRKNASDVDGAYQALFGNGSDDIQTSHSQIFLMNGSTDFIECYVQHNRGGDMTLRHNSSATRITITELF